MFFQPEFVHPLNASMAIIVDVVIWVRKVIDRDPNVIFFPPEGPLFGRI